MKNICNIKKLIMIFCAFFVVTFCKAVDVQLPQGIPSTRFLITDYGATTTNADNATAINAAITAARTAGGGIVVFPAGTFLSGPLNIPNGTTKLNLHFEEGDTLRMLPYGTYPGATYFIYPQSCSDIAITGKGVIDGNGASGWWAAYTAGTISSRPIIIRFKGCHRVLVDSITLYNAPNQHLVVGQKSTMGDNATVSNITVYADVPSPNTDAVDTWYWNGINIVNCNLSGGDDNIAMNDYSQNITVKNCIFGRGIVPSYLTGTGSNSTGHGCSIGSYTIAVQNIVVDSCIFNGTDYGIRIKSDRDRGGNNTVLTSAPAGSISSNAFAVQNLSYSNLTMTDINKIPIYMTCYYNSSDPTANPNVAAATVTATTPQYRNITFRNITASTVSTSSSSVRVMTLFGLPEMPISNLVFDNVQLNSLSTSSSSSVYVSYVNGLSFNCSNITKNGNPYTSNPYAFIQNTYFPFQSTISGIDISTGVATNCETGISSISVESVSCFPNPANDKMTVTAKYPIDRVMLYSVTGAAIKSISGYGEKQLSVNMSDIPKGYYFARVVGTNNTATALKVIKK